jgi:hypothetical protein
VPDRRTSSQRTIGGEQDATRQIGHPRQRVIIELGSVQRIES